MRPSTDQRGEGDCTRRALYEPGPGAPGNHSEGARRRRICMLSCQNTAAPPAQMLMTAFSLKASLSLPSQLSLA
eukprot:7748277-Pyramimonas_sp.AAC.1